MWNLVLKGIFKTIFQQLETEKKTCFRSFKQETDNQECQ